MFIQTEITPNPQTIKFIPQRDEGSHRLWQTREWKSIAEAKENPLALALFGLPSVVSVFVGGDFISITKNQQFNWEQIKPDIMNVLMEFFSLPSAEEIMTTAPESTSSPSAEAAPLSEAEQDIANKINEILETRVQPAVAQDGGSIELARFENGIAYLNMRGACAGCPASTMTLKNGVENLLRYYIPELERVEANELFE